METEIEVKFPHINSNELRVTLKEKGGILVHPEIVMRRKVFDYPDWKLEKIGGWVRVRDEGDKITMSYKQLNDRTLNGTKEVSIIVDDFERTCTFITSLGLELKAYQETRREKWMLNDIEVTIDTWPWVPTFVELEGPTEKQLKEAVALLNLDWNDAMHGSVETIYQMHYDFTEEEIDHWDSITFIPEPDWLRARKKP